eukprot:223078-Pleurochrysis_carterae.AAC.1
MADDWMDHVVGLHELCWLVPRVAAFTTVHPPCAQSRPVAIWELRMFFPQRSDGDMQEQLGLRRSFRQEQQNQLLLASMSLAFGGSAVASTAEGLSEAMRVGLGLALAATPYLLLTAGIALPDAVRTA